MSYLVAVGLAGLGAGLWMLLRWVGKAPLGPERKPPPDRLTMGDWER